MDRGVRGSSAVWELFDKAHLTPAIWNNVFLSDTDSFRSHLK
jgi:hypothetical protein